MEGDSGRMSTFFSNEAYSRGEMGKKVDGYKDLYDGDKADVAARKGNYMSMVNTFYDLVTNFYEFGWGQSFHFAPRHRDESFPASIARHEMWLAHRLELGPGKKVADIGCGIGGPARCIARFTQAEVVGVNNNAYQIQRGEWHNNRQNLSRLVSFKKCDFMNIELPEREFDAAYAIEATCHAPDKVGVYKQIHRILKPGGLVGLYEWVITPSYDASNAEHRRIKENIERGNGLPELEPVEHIRKCLEEAGFELIEDTNLAQSNFGDHAVTPWYMPLSGSFSVAGFKHTLVGRWLTNRFVALLETFWLAPKGTTEVSNILMSTANDLVAGGRQDIFTPMWFFLARKK